VKRLGADDSADSRVKDGHLHDEAIT